MEKQGKEAIEVDNSDRKDIRRAKQAISPVGLEDQSVEGNSGVGSEVQTKKLPPDELEDKYMDGDEIGDNVRVNNPNRNPNPKPDIDKPAYN